MTCHPGFADKMSSTFMTNARVQTDGCVTTSRGPGTAFDFTLFFVEQLYGKEKYEEVLEPLVRLSYAFGSCALLVFVYACKLLFLSLC